MTLLDTAGIRDTEDPVELEGVRRARERAAAADLVLWVVDAGEAGQNRPKSTKKAQNGPQNWLIRNKIDLLQGRNEHNATSRRSSEHKSDPKKALKNIVNNELTHKNESVSANNDLEFNLSAVTGEGFDQLLAQLARHAEDFLAGPSRPW